MASENQNIYYRLYRLFLEQNIHWVFCGKFTSEKTDLIIRFFENFLNQEDIVQKIQKRAFYIFVEGIQNVHRHQLTPEHLSFLQMGFLTFQQENSHIAFTMGNVIPVNQESVIATKLDELNKMSREELNNYYKKVLKNDVLSDKGGAGLGLIEIARKSKNLLNYKFVPIDENISFFYLKMAVSEKENIRSSKISEEPIKTFSDLHQMLIDKNISLSYHETMPSLLPEGLKKKTNFLLPDNYPDWVTSIMISIIDLLHQIFPGNTNEKVPAYIFCRSSDGLFHVVTGLEIVKQDSGNINKLPELLNTQDFGEIKQRSDKPPKVKIMDVSEKKQFVSFTFSFSL